jgi:hypothetical protein
VLVVEAVARLANQPNVGETRQQWLDRNAHRRLKGEIEIPRLVPYRTWEDLLPGHAILLNGVILQWVLGKGLT